MALSARSSGSQQHACCVRALYIVLLARSCVPPYAHAHGPCWRASQTQLPALAAESPYSLLTTAHMPIMAIARAGPLLKGHAEAVHHIPVFSWNTYSTQQCEKPSSPLRQTDGTPCARRRAARAAGTKRGCLGVPRLQRQQQHIKNTHLSALGAA